MKRVRVLKEMPFAKVGVIMSEANIYSHFPENTKKLITDGWLEWVEEYKCDLCKDTGRAPTIGATVECICKEEKSLEEEFKWHNLQKGDYSYTVSPSELAQIAAKHYEKKFDEATDLAYVRRNTQDVIDNIRKAMFGEE